MWMTSVQNRMNVAAGSTPVMNMPSAPVLSRDIAAPTNWAEWGTGLSAEYSAKRVADMEYRGSEQMCLSSGVKGSHCEKDIDECTGGIIECHNHSCCVNLPGWYHCKCRSSF